MYYPKSRLTRPVQVCLLAGGFVAGSLSKLPSADWQLAMAAAICAAAAWRQRKLLGPALLIIGSCAGLVRADIAATRSEPLAALNGNKVALTGTITSDPVAAKKLGYDFELGGLSQGSTGIPGQLQVLGFNSHLKRGYKVEVSGKIRPGFKPGSYEMPFAEVVVISDHISWLEELRQRFFAGVRDALPSPVSDFVLGILIGIRALIGPDLQTELNSVGLSHLVAVSGYNLAIISGAVAALSNRISRRMGLLLPLTACGLFVAVCGFTPSLVRAAVVAGIGLICSYYGRKPKPLTVIGLGIIITLMWNPSYLTDLGWQLSFLAFFGILVLAPYLERRLIKKPGPVSRLFAEALAAQIMTWPLLAYVFGQATWLALVSNVLIMPLVPAMMLLGFLAGLAGMMAPAVAGWLAAPAYLLVRGVLAMIEVLSGLASSTPPKIGYFEMLLFYGLVLLIIVSLASRTQLAQETESDII